jgi:hypothetical protein
MEQEHKFGIYNSKLSDIDPTYYMKIKRKVENLLDEILIEHNLTQYESAQMRHRVSMDLLIDSPFRKLYMNSKDKYGKILKRGEDYIADTFEEWFFQQFPDYNEVLLIYSEICRARRIAKEDLHILNNIAKGYTLNENDNTRNTGEN